MMEGTFKTNRHTPPHLYIDDEYYMITGGIYQKRYYLAQDDVKEIFIRIIQEFIDKYAWILIDWVILNNHYHMFLKSRLGKDLSRIMGGIHRKSANLIKKQLRIKCRRFWWNYWDTCPKDERQLYNVKNYIYYNPVKHGLVENIGDYEWSSFAGNLEENGREEMERRFRVYGYKSLTVNLMDDF